MTRWRRAVLAALPALGAVGIFVLFPILIYLAAGQQERAHWLDQGTIQSREYEPAHMGFGPHFNVWTGRIELGAHQVGATWRMAVKCKHGQEQWLTQSDARLLWDLPDGAAFYFLRWDQHNHAVYRVQR